MRKVWRLVVQETPHELGLRGTSGKVERGVHGDRVFGSWRHGKLVRVLMMTLFGAITGRWWRASIALGAVSMTVGAALHLVVLRDPQANWHAPSQEAPVPRGERAPRFSSRANRPGVSPCISPR